MDYLDFEKLYRLLPGAVPSWMMGAYKAFCSALSICLLLSILLPHHLLATPLNDAEPQLVIDSGGHTAKIKDIMFTQDGRHLVSAGYDKVIRVWNLETGETERTLRGEIGDGPGGEIFAAALSPQDRYLAVGGWLAGDAHKWSIRVHDFKTGKVEQLLSGHDNAVLDLAFAPDGRRLASASADGTVCLWDAGEGRLLHRLIGHTHYVQAVAFSPDGTRMVSGSWDLSLRLWNVESGALIQVLTGHDNFVMSAAFSLDGNYIASGSQDGTIYLWNARTGKLVRALARKLSPVTSLTFSPDGRQLLAGAGGFENYEPTLFSVPSGNEILRFGEHDNIVLATAISPDGKMAATGGGEDKQIYLWETATGKVLRKLAGRGQIVWSVGFAWDGRSIAYGNLFDGESYGQYLGPLQKVILLRRDDRAYEVSLGGDVENPSAYIQALHRHNNYRLRTKDGRYGHRSILEVLRGTETLHEIERSPTTGLRHRSYTFTDGSKYIVSGGSNGVLTLYRTDTAERVHNFVGHTGDILALAVSADGKTLISGSSDQTIRLWDVDSGKNLLTFFVGSDGQWVASTPEGYYTSSLEGDQYIGWHLNQGANKAAKYYSADQFQRTFYRPDVVASYLASRDIQKALQQAGNQQQELRPETIADSIPPEVIVLSPSSGDSTVREARLTLKAVVVSPRLHPTARVLVNGSLVGKVSLAPEPGRKSRWLLTHEVALDRGENVISIIASHEKADSKTENIKVVYADAPPRALPSLVVLGIGISQYLDETLRLAYADDDARAIGEIMKRQKGRLFNEVKIKLLLDSEATEEEIIRGLKWMESEATDHDVRLLFLAGHGALDTKDNYYFLPYDSQSGEPDVYGIPWSRLLQYLTDLPGDAILMVDTCRAAAVAGEGRRGQQLVDFDQVLKRNDYTGLRTFAASTSREVSVELPELKHGAFTAALIEGLSGKADGWVRGQEQKEKDGFVHTQELEDWIRDRVQSLTDGKQHAVYYARPPDLPPLELSANKGL